MLIAHRIDISEGLCSGIVGHVTCLSTRADLPRNAFIGLPLSVQRVTDRGAFHPICAIVTDARAFDFDLSSLDRAKYPARETLLQFSRVGRGFHPAAVPSRVAAWFTAAGKRCAAPSADSAGESPVHTLVLGPPDETAAVVGRHGALSPRRGHRSARLDHAVGGLASAVPGNVQRASWDYKSAAVNGKRLPALAVT